MARRNDDSIPEDSPLLPFISLPRTGILVAVHMEIFIVLIIFILFCLETFSNRELEKACVTASNEAFKTQVRILSVFQLPGLCLNL